ncbi:Hypothetical protein CINCED_3A023411 [Cinara cedri]|uniref:RNA-directed DNA polymerase n=1 Tax=Cinara cedri TaxID=506608 RepID=A0A5E4MDJ6_9HEMI|nr:Hypothetical protein CINCED_3A023411 [Cinara cedri]
MLLATSEWVPYRTENYFRNSADGLSRLPVDIGKECGAGVSHLHYVDEMKVLNASLVQKENNNDPLLKKVNKELEVFRHKQELLSLEQNTILWGYRIVIPKSIQNKILEKLHYNHLVVVKMKSIARGHLWWLGIDKDIENIASKYDDCNKNEAKDLDKTEKTEEIKDIVETENAEEVRYPKSIKKTIVKLDLE